MRNTSTAIIIPAYNEETTIVKTLKTLLSDARPSEFNVTVVCNGCHDRTAQVTRAAFRDVNVIELNEASKTAAINAGLRTVRSPRIVLLDSDIRISTAACRSLADALNDPDIDAAIGHMVIDDSDCSRSVKAFYRVWIRHPYVSNGKFAAAIAISKNAFDRIGELPDVIADDTYLQRMIPSDRIAVVDGMNFLVSVPRSLPALIHVRSRVQRGNRQLNRFATALPSSRTENKMEFFRSIVRNPSLWRDIPVYLVVAIASRVLAMKQKSGWERDWTTRQAATE